MHYGLRSPQLICEAWKRVIQEYPDGFTADDVKMIVSTFTKANDPVLPPAPENRPAESEANAGELSDDSAPQNPKNDGDAGDSTQGNTKSSEPQGGQNGASEATSTDEETTAEGEISDSSVPKVDNGTASGSENAPRRAKAKTVRGQLQTLVEKLRRAVDDKADTVKPLLVELTELIAKVIN